MYKKLIISLLSLLYVFTAQQYAYANTISAARVWPSKDYTRITFEAISPIKYQLLILKNPDRLVLDVEDVDLNIILKTLSDRILSGDPYIKQVRTAKFKTNVVRVVIDLKTEVNPNVFTLEPAGDYRHRLVVDIYPNDPLMAMLGKQQKEDELDDIPAEVDSKVEPLPPLLEPEDQANNTSAPLDPNRPLDQAVISEPTKAETGLPEGAQKKAGRVLTIAIDAGHGGEDPGAKGANGSHEKHITLAIAKKLKARIDAEDTMKGVLIRDDDYFVPLGERVQKARKLKADLFISIHADSFTNASARGSSVFALSQRGATSASARYLAQKENQSDLIGGVSLVHKDKDLAKTLLDLSQTATINDGIKLGKLVLSKMGDVNKLHKNHIEQAAFAVLKSPDIPSILVETAFISNPEEERKLNDPTHQDKLVNAILLGIKQYLATTPSMLSAQ